MLISRITDFACPKPNGSSSTGSFCGGSLQISDGCPVNLAEGNPDDVLEALITCQTCHAGFPVIRGVVILDPDITKYVGRYYHEICRGVVENSGNQSMPDELLQFLKAAFLAGGQAKGGGEWDQDLPQVASRYLQAHYGSMTERLADGDRGWSEFVRAYKRDHDLYDVLCSMLRENANYSNARNGLAVDVGCSVGRMAHALAADFNFVYGIDLSFGAILNARRIVRASPSLLSTYKLITDAGAWSGDIPLEVEKRSNVEFLVGSASALPFPNTTVACLTSVNLIDTLPQAQEFFSEASRILASEKILILSDPYCWKEEAKREFCAKGSSRSVVESLRSHGFTITAQRDCPWLLQFHDREWDVYICDCLVALRLP